MVRKIFIGLAMLPALAHANPVNMEFQQVSIVELLQTVIKGVLKKDYVIEPDVLTDTRKVTISLKDKTEQNIKNIMTDFLLEQGIEMKEQGGLIFVRQVEPPQQQQTAPGITAIAPAASVLESFNPQPAVELETAPPLPLRTYKPRSRPVLELLPLVKFGGGQPMEIESDLLVYRATDDNHEQITGLIEAYDKPSGELLVKAYLYEVSQTDRQSSAFSAALELLSGKLQIDINGIRQPNSLKIALPDIEAVFSALDSDQRFKVVSSPSLHVKHGKVSKFSVGSEVPVLGEFTANQVGQIVQSVNYRPAGVIFQVKPAIFDQDIELEILQQVSNFVPTQTGVNNSPTLIKRELLTTVNAQHGDLILMGGLDEAKDTGDSLGLPFLPAFLRSRQAEQTKTEILLVLHVQRI